MPYRPPKLFIPLILAVGTIRFALTVADLTYWARYASMTTVILIASIFLSSKETTRRERVIISYALIAPYMLVEAVGLGYTWWSGNETIFQLWPYNLGTPVHIHFWGHIIGGLTWEPLLVYGLITGIANVWGKKN